MLPSLDFRHAHVLLLINNGEDYLVVKERLGHASITTTIDTYSHLYPSKQKDLADKLDDLLLIKWYNIIKISIKVGVKYVYNYIFNLEINKRK